MKVTTRASKSPLRLPLVSGLAVALIAVFMGLLPGTGKAAVPPEYAVHATVDLAPSAPQLTAIDPFTNGLTPSNPLKPDRPFWYSVDKDGLTIVGLRTETTGALMVGGPPINVVENEVVGYVPWPDAISVTQPDGEVPTDPAVDPEKFAYRPAGGWEPVGITVSYPTDEALASNSETPATYVYVVMKHSGFEWQSTPTAELPAGRDPNLRDKIVAQPDPNKDGSLLVQVDVSQPNYPADLFPTGVPIGGGLLGHNAGQPAFDVASGSVYVGNMPSTSLPTTPVDLRSFVSVATLAPAEMPLPGEVPAPVTVTVLCGPEHPDIALLAGVPESWACIAEGGEGPFEWTFTNLPAWLTAHVDPITGQGDGILYGTPPVGVYTFEAHVDDNATTPPGTGDATITLTVSSDPTTEYEYGELEWEVGAPAAVAIEGTQVPETADPCKLEATSSPGSLVPSWVDVAQVTGRHIDNSAFYVPDEDTIGCVIMGTPPISGERYEFQMPNLHFPWPANNVPLIISGQVAGPYTFDPLPTGVGLSGLAWHEIDKIHDASTEADLLNREFFGVEPYTGQMYRILPAYAGLEAEGTIVPPPALQGELDEVVPEADVLTTLTTARPDIAAVLAANPNLKVKFGDLVVEANPDPNVYVTAVQISDPTGVDPTVIPIGGPHGSTIAIGAMLKVSGTRTDVADPTVITWSTTSTINLPGVQAYSLGLDSDLTPAIRGSEPGQVDHGVLWVTGTNTGNVEVVNTALAKYVQMLAVPGATSLGGASVNALNSNSATRYTYLAGKSLQSVITFGPGEAPHMAPEFWTDNTATFSVGFAGSFTVMATGWHMPALSEVGDLPGGVTFVDNADGTATLAGTPDAGTDGVYEFIITAANGVSPDATQNFTLTVNAPPLVTTQPSNQTVTAPATATFTAAASGNPTPTVQWQLSTDNGLTWADISGATNTGYTTPATTAAMNGYQYRAVFTNSVGTATTNAATLTVNAAPVVTTQPSNQTVTEAQTATFSAAASGNPTPTVQWQESTDGGTTWAGISGATNTDYTTPVTTTAMNGYQYQAVFTNSVGTATSNVATLTVNASAPVPSCDTYPCAWSPDTIWGTNGAGNAIDGDIATWWQPIGSNSPTTPTLSVNFGAPTTISAVSTQWVSPAFAPAGYTIQAYDGATWVTQLTVSGNTQASRADNLPAPVDTQYLRIVVDAPATANPYAAIALTELGWDGHGVTFPVAGSPDTIWGTNGAGNAIDGNVATWWQPVGSNSPTTPTLVVNFGAPIAIGAVSTDWYSAAFAPASYAIQTYDGATWVTQLTVTGNTQASRLDNLLAPVDTRYLRIVVDAPATANPYAAIALTEFGWQEPAATAPTVTTQPFDDTVAAGETASFTSTAAGNPTPTVQWQLSTDSGSTWTDIPGATSTTYTTPATTAADSGNQYHAVFTNTASTATSNAATLTIGTAPAVTTQPSNQTVTAGQTATFTAAASGSPTPTVQWQLYNGSTWADISGATNPDYTTPATTAAMNGYQYRAVFTNSASSATSDAATLTVNAAPAVTTQPSNQTVTEGQTATFTAAASGNPIPTVQWELSTDGGSNWSNISGATSTSYTTPATTAAMTGYQYRAVFTNNASSATSDAATLTVDTVPVVTTQPSNQTVTAPQTATFTAAASGSPIPTVQWELSTDGGSTWSNISGATSPSYITPVTTTAMNGYQYQAVFTNIAGTATSNAATLTVNAAPAITSASTATFWVGTAGSINVTTTGSPTPALSESGDLPGGVTFVDNGNGTATLAGTPDAGTGGSYPFTITATNGVSPDATQNFTLTVNAAPVVTTQPSNQTVTAPQTATFTAAASGYPAPTVHWEGSLNGGSTWLDISGATSATYTTPATTAAMNGYQYRAVFTNSTGTATTNTATLTVTTQATLVVVTTSLSQGTQGQAYSQQLEASGGLEPYTWARSGRQSLPAGLTLSSDGMISGTPLKAGHYNFTVVVTDFDGHTATQRLELTIARPPRR